MTLDKYIFKELLKSQLMVLLVLVAIFVGQSIVRLMTEAALGQLPPRLILLFLLYSLPDFLTYLFPLTLYVSIIITIGRICSDSEMVVMRAIGYSPVRVMFVSLLLGVGAAALVGFISIELTYRAADARYTLQQQASSDPEFLPIDSGRFVNFGRYNIYVEEVDTQSENKDIHQIYVIETVPENLGTRPAASITAANEGHLMLDPDGVRWLWLNDGRRYELPLDGTYRRAHFDEFKAPLAGNITEETRKKGVIERMTMAELFASSEREAQVEAQWRLSPILATLVLSMVAVPLSMVNPRQGRFARLMPAILIYAAYYLFLLSLRNLMLTNTIALWPGLVLVPVFFLFLVAIPLNLPKSHFKKMRQRRLSGPKWPRGGGPGGSGGSSSARSVSHSAAGAAAGGADGSADGSADGRAEDSATGSKEVAP